MGMEVELPHEAFLKWLTEDRAAAGLTHQADLQDEVKAWQSNT